MLFGVLTLQTLETIMPNRHRYREVTIFALRLMLFGVLALQTLEIIMPNRHRLAVGWSHQVLNTHSAGKPLEICVLERGERSIWKHSPRSNTHISNGFCTWAGLIVHSKPILLDNPRKYVYLSEASVSSQGEICTVLVRVCTWAGFCNQCNAISAMQSMQCNLRNAIDAM